VCSSDLVDLLAYPVCSEHKAEADVPTSLKRVISRLFHSAAGTSSMEAKPERSAYRAALHLKEGDTIAYAIAGKK
jgi:hypothetical protein